MKRAEGKKAGTLRVPAKRLDLKKQVFLRLLALLVLAVAYSGTGSYQGGQTSVNGDVVVLVAIGRWGTGVGRLSVNSYGQNNGKGGESVFHMTERIKRIRCET